MPIVCFLLWLFTINAFSLFLFFSSDMYKHITHYAHSHPERGSKWMYQDTFYWKLFFLKLNFQRECGLCANCLFYILTISLCLLFQFLSCGIHVHITILTGVQDGCITSWKNSHILHFFFWSLISKMKISGKPIAYFIFWLFTVNAFFFSS